MNKVRIMARPSSTASNMLEQITQQGSMPAARTASSMGTPDATPKEKCRGASPDEERA